MEQLFGNRINNIYLAIDDTAVWNTAAWNTAALMEHSWSWNKNICSCPYKPDAYSAGYLKQWEDEETIMLLSNTACCRCDFFYGGGGGVGGGGLCVGSALFHPLEITALM